MLLKIEVYFVLMVLTTLSDAFVGFNVDFLSTRNVETSFDLRLLAVVVEMASLPILAVAIYVVYVGVEIDHPVFRLIFNNLIVAFIDAAVIVSTAVFADTKTIIQILAFGNLITLLHHHSTWMILSGLRYAYIVEPDWLHSKFPDAQQLRRLSVGSVSLSFLLIVGIVLAILIGSIVPLGWPRISFFLDVSWREKSSIIAAVSAAYHFPTFVSLIFYITLVRKTSEKVSRIGVEPASVCPISVISGLSETTIRQSEISFSPEEPARELSGKTPQPIRANGFFSSPEDLEKSRTIDEKISALRSLKTNLVVFACGLGCSVFIYSMPARYQESLNLVGTSLAKTMFPLLTSLASFGTVRSVGRNFFKNTCIDKNRSY